MDLWFENHNELVAFARVMDEMRLFANSQYVIDYFEKPYKWQDEYDIWVRHGKPTVDDRNWFDFEREIDRMASAE